MKIQFYTCESDLAFRDWPVPPRVGDGIRLEKVDYSVVEVNWGDHVTGTGQPIKDSPCVSVQVEPLVQELEDRDGLILHLYEALEGTTPERCICGCEPCCCGYKLGLDTLEMAKPYYHRLIR